MWTGGTCSVGSVINARRTTTCLDSLGTARVRTTTPLHLRDTVCSSVLNLDPAMYPRSIVLCTSPPWGLWTTRSKTGLRNSIDVPPNFSPLRRSCGGHSSFPTTHLCKMSAQCSIIQPMSGGVILSFSYLRFGHDLVGPHHLLKRRATPSRKTLLSTSQLAEIRELLVDHNGVWLLPAEKSPGHIEKRLVHDSRTCKCHAPFASCLVRRRAGKEES